MKIRYIAGLVIAACGHFGLPLGHWREVTAGLWARHDLQERVAAGNSHWSADNVQASPLTLVLENGIGAEVAREFGRAEQSQQSSRSEFPHGATGVRFHLGAIQGVPGTSAVVGLFCYRNDQHEVDIEFAQWDDPHDRNNAQFTFAGTRQHQRFACDLSAPSTHMILQRESTIWFSSVCSNGTSNWSHPAAPGFLAATRVHMNVWQREGRHAQRIVVPVANIEFAP